MNAFAAEIAEQPVALRRCIDYYMKNPTHIGAAPGESPVLIGMGASYHAAAASSLYAHSIGHPMVALEAADTLNYGSVLLRQARPLVFISQSGMSAEVAPVLDIAGGQIDLAVTNDPDSVLGQSARLVLPLMAGLETTVATKTYLNTLAVLWLLVRQRAGLPFGADALLAAAEHVERVITHADATVDRWLDVLAAAQSIVCIGHGPHAVTARQTAMMINEWAKYPAWSVSLAAFRHGFIESAGPGVGVVVFAPAGKTQASALALAEQLRGYGARVLVAGEADDEFLSPLIDIVPAQLFAEAFARHRGVAPGFRYISKVVTAL